LIFLKRDHFSPPPRRTITHEFVRLVNRPQRKTKKKIKQINGNYLNAPTCIILIGPWGFVRYFKRRLAPSNYRMPGSTGMMSLDEVANFGLGDGRPAHKKIRPPIKHGTRTKAGWLLGERRTGLRAVWWRNTTISGRHYRLAYRLLGWRGLDVEDVDPRVSLRFAGFKNTLACASGANRRPSKHVAGPRSPSIAVARDGGERKKFPPWRWLEGTTGTVSKRRKNTVQKRFRGAR